MKKQDLRNGDIVLTRGGELGVVILDLEYVLYQNIGMDDLILFTDDLLADGLERDFDIMEVYRGCSFIDLEDEMPIYQRLDDAGIQEIEEQYKNLQPVKSEPKQPKELLEIVTQAFYGNRTGLTIKKENVDHLLEGNTSGDRELYYPNGRTIIQLPNSKAVLVYNKYQEEYQLKQNEEWLLEDGYVAKPLASIPELNLDIYSRCFICRMDEQGNLQNIEDEDDEVIEKYLIV